MAAKRSDFEMYRLIAGQYTPYDLKKVTDSDGNTLLHIATQAGVSFHIIQHLVEVQRVSTLVNPFQTTHAHTHTRIRTHTHARTLSAMCRGAAAFFVSFFCPFFCHNLARQDGAQHHQQLVIFGHTFV